MKKLVTSVVFLCLTFISYSQNIEWKKCFGGSDKDMAWSVINSNDNGYIIAGDSKSNDGDVVYNNGSADYWIIKIDNMGEIIWEKNYGITNFERSRSVISANDGGYIIAGYRNLGGGSDFWIVKINEDGDLIWDKLYGGSNFDNAYKIVSTNDNGYIITGTTVLEDNYYRNAISVIKIDNYGSVIWEKFILDSECLNFGSSALTSDNGLIFTADDCQPGSNYIIVKLDEDGNIDWQKEYGGSLTDTPSAIKQIEGGGYIVIGSAASQDGDVVNNHGGYDYWVIKIDDNGDLISSKCFGGSDNDQADDVIQNDDNEFIIAGYSRSNNGDVSNHTGWEDYWIINIDSENNIKWEKCYGDTGEDKARSIVQAGDNSYLIAGYTNSYEGEVTGNHGDYDYWVIKITENSNSINNYKESIDCKIYPNPTKKLINIEGENIQEIQVFDIYGKTVLKSCINIDVIDLSKLSNGFYFVKVKNDKGMAVEKIVLE